MRVAFVGLGHMGVRMAAHVAAAGHTLTVCDVQPDRAARLAAVGARVAANPAEAAADAEVVSVVVRDDDQVLEVTTGTDGVLTSLEAGAVVAIHSTVTRECIRRVDRAAADRHVQVLDAGISGGIGGAASGTLLVMVGGDAAALDAVRLAFAAWSREIVHVGPLGAGMVAKAARNFAQYACFAAVHEAQALAQAGNVALAQFAHIVTATNALESASALLERGDVTPRSEAELGARAGYLVDAADLAAKDLDVTAAIARELDVELPSLPGARASFAASLGLEHPS